MQNAFQVVTASLTLGAAGLLLGAGSASALTPPTVPVLVNGTTYDVTYFEGSYDNNISRFTTAEMPWWGDSSLANTFATAIGVNLGRPLFNNFGPGFAYTLETSDPSDIKARLYTWDENYFPDPATFNGALSVAVSYPYAIAAPHSPAPVPAPLPLFGAAAAFRATRRLRSMRRTLHCSTTAGS